MRRLGIVLSVIMLWVIPVVYGQLKWQDAEKRNLLKKISRVGYEMRLYNIKGFYVLRYYTPEGEQIGLSYWRTDHKSLTGGDVYVHHYISNKLALLDHRLVKYK